MKSRTHFLPRACLAATACLSLFATAAAAQVSQADRVFSGKLGNKYRIQIRLHRDGGSLAGSYFMSAFVKTSRCGAR